MSTYATPEPITVTVEIGVGEIIVVAGDRADTTVDVRPTHPDRRGDVAAAEQTRVDLGDGQLLVRAPRGWRQFMPWSGGESVTVTIEVPTGSHLRTDASVATVQGHGRLGDCNLRAAAGEVRLDDVTRLRVKHGAGAVEVRRVERDAEVTTGSGTVRIASVGGAAVVRNANGETVLGEVAGDARIVSANGRIAVERARAAVVAKTANGDVRLEAVECGDVVAQTSRGSVDIGVREGVAAWLDLATQFGTIQNELDSATRPAQGEGSVSVRAQTSFGDIRVRRAVAAGAVPVR